MEAIKVPSAGLVHDMDRAERIVREDLKDRISHLLISSTCIKERVSDLALSILDDEVFRSAEEIQVVAVLKGAANFANMLAQEIFKQGGPPVRFNYIKAISYGDRITSSGHVSISGQLPYIKGKELLIIEDIVDTGMTLSRLKKYLMKERGASSVRICALLDKRCRRIPELNEEVVIDHAGFEVPDLFVAGYGIDCAEQFRELPYIVAVKDEYFSKEGKQ